MFSFNYSINVSSIYTLIFSWHRARGRIFARAVFLFDVYYCLHSHKVLRISISHPSNGECHIHHACLVFYVPIRSLGPDAPPTFCHNLFYTLRQIVHLFIVPRYTHTHMYIHHTSYTLGASIEHFTHRTIIVYIWRKQEEVLVCIPLLLLLLSPCSMYGFSVLGPRKSVEHKHD